MSYCHIHGSFDDYFKSGCPTCRAAEERAATNQEDLRYAISEAARSTANPGDYECPHCLYLSLKKDASRCPLCHGEVRSGYWDVVRVREKADEERRAAALEAAAEEQIRTAPERAAAARAARVETLQRTISSEHDEIANGWKYAGIAVAIDAGLFLVGTVCANASNGNRGTLSIGGWFAGLFGSLGAIVFGLAAWLGVVVVVGLVLFQLFNTAKRLGTVAKVKGEIKKLQGSRE
ncbi:MAG TPA: hypothetical protein VN937_09105 [Blastocatellia bacterium]|nr:hypothetical protein [Blastocatellia bacterium]